MASSSEANSTSNTDQKTTSPTIVVNSANPYKGPAFKSVAELTNLDAGDESLVKYKQQLLGYFDDIAYDKNDKRKVIVTRVEVHSPELATPKFIDVGVASSGDLLKIKEGCLFHIEVSYHVQHEIVSGLKYEQTVKCKGITVDKDSVMIGSYAPRKQHYIYKTEEENAAKGMLKRHVYNVKSRFVDDDNNVHIAWEWKFEIAKSWD